MFRYTNDVTIEDYKIAIKECDKYILQYKTKIGEYEKFINKLEADKREFEGKIKEMKEAEKKDVFVSFKEDIMKKSKEKLIEVFMEPVVDAFIKIVKELQADPNIVVVFKRYYGSAYEFQYQVKDYAKLNTETRNKLKQASQLFKTIYN